MTTAPTSAREAATRPPAEPPLVEPGPADWWEETPAQAARYDRAHFDRDEA